MEAHCHARPVRLHHPHAVGLQARWKSDAPARAETTSRSPRDPKSTTAAPRNWGGPRAASRPCTRASRARSRCPPLPRRTPPSTPLPRAPSPEHALAVGVDSSMGRCRFKAFPIPKLSRIASSTSLMAGLCAWREAHGGVALRAELQLRICTWRAATHAPAAPAEPAHKGEVRRSGRESGAGGGFRCAAALGLRRVRKLTCAMQGTLESRVGRRSSRCGSAAAALQRQLRLASSLACARACQGLGEARDGRSVASL